MAPTRENRAGQQKAGTAADVAGTEATVGAAGTDATPDTITTTVEIPVRETAGPLGAHYVTGADGAPVAVDAASQPAVAPGEGAAPSVAVVDVETAATPALPGTTPAIAPVEHVTVVHEVIAGEPSQPVFANPGPPSATPEGAKVAHATPDPE